MKNLIFILLLFLTSCGFNGEQKLTQGGTSYTYVVVRLEFIEQIKQMCQDSYILEDFANEKLYKQAVAQCTFKNLSLTGITQVQGNNFITTYCMPNSDLSSFNSNEQANIIATCNALGY